VVVKLCSHIPKRIRLGEVAREKPRSITELAAVRFSAAGKLCPVMSRPYIRRDVASQIISRTRRFQSIACPGVPWDRSVPGFLTTQNSQRPRMLLSVEKGA
jgi:hypothetical protein